MKYQWIRSKRKTIAIQIREDGTVIVRSPEYPFPENHRRFSERKAGVDRNASEKRRNKEGAGAYHNGGSKREEESKEPGKYSRKNRLFLQSRWE